MKSTPTVFAASSIASAISLYPPLAAPMRLAGETDSRLLTMGMPYLDWMSSTTSFSLPARESNLLRTLSAVRVALSEMQSKRLRCIVTVRMSRC